MRWPVILGGALLGFAAAGDACSQTAFASSVTPESRRITTPGVRPVFLGIADGGAAFVAVGTDFAVASGRQGKFVTVDRGTVVAAYSSDRGHYTAMLVRSDASDQRSALSLQVLSAELEPVYQVSLRHSYDDPYPGLSIDDRDGSAAVLYHADGSVDFHSASGELIRSEKLAEGAYEIERTILAARAVETGRVALVVNEPVEDGRRSVSAAAIRIFSDRGDPEMLITIPALAASAVGISPDGDRFAVGQFDVGASIRRTTFYDDEGREISRIGFGAETIDFDRDGGRTLLADKHNLVVVRADPGVVEQSFRVADARRTLLAASLSEDGRFAAAVPGRTIFRDGRFEHDTLQLVEFVESPTGGYDQRTQPLSGSAADVDVAVSAGGVAVSLDAVILEYRRPP